LHTTFGDAADFAQNRANRVQNALEIIADKKKFSRPAGVVQTPFCFAARFDPSMRHNLRWR